MLRLCGPPRFRRGLSIVELVIVTAVLSILAAVIYPLFTRTRNYSYQAECAARMRQLGAAFALYASDWSGYWPSPGGLVGDRSYWSQSGSGGLHCYINQRGVNSVWCCPLMREWHGKYPARSYSMNSYLREPADAEYPTCLGFLRGINVANISEPGRTVLLFEGIPLTNGWEDQLDYIYRCANWSRARGYTDNIVHTIAPGTPWHGRSNNYLYTDCHIKTRPPGRKTAGVLSTYDEMYEWYVDKSRFRRVFAACR